MIKIQQEVLAQFLSKIALFSLAGVLSSTPAFAAAGPDLQIQTGIFALSATQAAPGEPISAAARVVNSGGMGSKATTANIRISRSATSPTTTDPLLATLTFGVLAPNTSVPLTASLRIPADYSAGPAFVWIILDPNSWAGQSASAEANDRTAVPITIVSKTATPTTPTTGQAPQAPVLEYGSTIRPELGEGFKLAEAPWLRISHSGNNEFFRIVVWDVDDNKVTYDTKFYATTHSIPASVIQVGGRYRFEVTANWQGRSSAPALGYFWMAGTRAGISLPATITISSGSFNLAAGGRLVVEGIVRDSAGLSVANVDVFAEDGFYRQTRILGRSDAQGRFSAHYDAPASAPFGLYAIRFTAGTATQLAVIQVSNTTQPFLELPALDLRLGAVSALSGDALALTAKSTPMLATSTPVIDQLKSTARSISVNVGPAIVDELKRRGRDPFTYILVVGAVVCVVPASAAAVAPVCPYVFEEVASAAADSIFRITANSIVNASTMSAEDKALVKQIIDKVDNVRSMVALARSGAVLSRFDLYGSTWGAASALWEIRTDAENRVTQISLTGAGQGESETRSLVIIPKVPVARSGSMPVLATSTASGSGSISPTPSTTSSSGVNQGGTNAGGTNSSSGPAPTTSGSASTAVITNTATTPTAVVPSSRIVEISTLALAGGGSPLISGFRIAGDASKTVVVRAIGPTLTQFGVSGALSDPILKMFDNAGRQIGENDDWGGDTGITNAFRAVGLFPLEIRSKDAALLITVSPGTYTVQASTRGTALGVALLEVYELP